MIALVRSLSSSWGNTAQKLSGRQRTLLRGAITLVDQSVASATNFLTTVIIGRACLPEELGRYALGFSVMLALLGLPRSLVWTPYVSYFPQLPEADRRGYTGSSLLLQLLICLGMGMAVSLAGVVFTWRDMLEGFGPVCIVLGPAIAAMLAREYVRRVCFARLQMEQALLVDGATSVLQIGGLMFLASADLLNAVSAWAVIAVACASVVLAWAWMSRDNWHIDKARFRKDTARNWSFARWLLGEAGIQAVTEMWYPWALLLWWGTATVGVFWAAQGIVCLANPLLIAFANFISPHAAHVLADNGVAAMRSMLNRMCALVAVPIGSITIVIAFWGDSLVKLSFGEKFLNLGWVMTMLSLALWIDAMSVPFYAGNVALGRGKTLAVAMLMRMTCAMLLGTFMVAKFGALGVGYTLIISYTASGLWLWWSMRLNSRAAEVVHA